MLEKLKFGSWLKSERENKGLTQQQLAQLLDMRHSQEIAAIESGTIKFSHKKAGLLAKAFGVPKEKILQNLVKIKEKEMIEDSNQHDITYKKKGLL